MRAVCTFLSTYQKGTAISLFSLFNIIHSKTNCKLKSGAQVVDQSVTHWINGKNALSCLHLVYIPQSIMGTVVLKQDYHWIIMSGKKSIKIIFFMLHKKNPFESKWSSKCQIKLVLIFMSHTFLCLLTIVIKNDW